MLPVGSILLLCKRRDQKADAPEEDPFNLVAWSGPNSSDGVGLQLGVAPTS